MKVIPYELTSSLEVPLAGFLRWYRFEWISSVEFCLNKQSFLYEDLWGKSGVIRESFSESHRWNNPSNKILSLVQEKIPRFFIEKTRAVILDISGSQLSIVKPDSSGCWVNWKAKASEIKPDKTGWIKEMKINVSTTHKYPARIESLPTINNKAKTSGEKINRQEKV